jgi:hypothetical protein
VAVLEAKQEVQQQYQVLLVPVVVVVVEVEHLQAPLEVTEVMV